MMITDKLAGVKTAVLAKVVDRDEDARMEIQRRRLCYLSNQEIERWRAKNELAKMSIWYRQHLSTLCIIPEQSHFRNELVRREAYHQDRIARERSRPLRKQPLRERFQRSLKKTPAREKFRKLLSTLGI